MTRPLFSMVETGSVNFHTSWRVGWGRGVGKEEKSQSLTKALVEEKEGREGGKKSDLCY